MHEHPTQYRAPALPEDRRRSVSPLILLRDFRVPSVAHSVSHPELLECRVSIL